MMGVGERVESNHQPIYVELKGRITRNKGEKGERKIKKAIWTEESKDKFIEKMEGVEFFETEIEEE